MATVPPPDSIPETPPMNPGGPPDEITPPRPDFDNPDIDMPDPGDPGENPGFAEAEAHPS